MTEQAKQAESAYLVLGGELESFSGHKYADSSQIEIVGIFPDYDSAHKAWKGRTMETVDNALQHYCIIGLDAALKYAHNS